MADTWWQTETDSFMTTPLSSTIELETDSATRSLLGVQPALIGNEDNPLEGVTEGSLVITDS